MEYTHADRNIQILDISIEYAMSIGEDSIDQITGIYKVFKEIVEEDCMPDGTKIR